MYTLCMPAETLVAIYSRVSTAQQSDDAQVQELLDLCRRSHWELASIYREKASGTKREDERPALKGMLDDARSRRFHKVVVWSVDRLGRSMRHLIRVLGELKDVQVDVLSYKQGIDTSTMHGQVLWQVLGIFAELEHGLRQERQAQGIASAKKRGVRFGRPPNETVSREIILSLRAQGMGINKIAKTLHVGSSTVSRVLPATGPLKS